MLASTAVICWLLTQKHLSAELVSFISNCASFVISGETGLSRVTGEHYTSTTCTRALRHPFVKATQTGLFLTSTRNCKYYRSCVILCGETHRLARLPETVVCLPDQTYGTKGTVAPERIQALISAMGIAVILKNNPVLSGGVAHDPKRAIVHVPQRTAATAAATAARHSVIPAAAGVYTVTLVLPGGKEAVFRAGASKSIYDIASYAGVHLPASCK